MLLPTTFLLAAAASAAHAQSINQINGNAFLSPYSGKAVTGVVGVVTAKSSAGLFLRSPKPSKDPRVSNGLYVFSASLATNATIAVGDTLTLDGTVVDYRNNPAYLYSVELTAPVVQAHKPGRGVAPKPRVIGVDTFKPPTQQFTSLDGGDVFGVPNNVTQVSVANPVLQPAKYGLDFWKSLNGDLVTIPRPVAVSKANRFGETWMVGAWPTGSKNSRGGLTLSSKDGNPEAILVDSPIDGTPGNRSFVVGTTFADITGVIRYQFGFYYLVPTAAPVPLKAPSPALPPPTTLLSTGKCSGITVADYNVENFMPTDAAHAADVAAHIVDYLKNPDVLHVQEIQDDSGATNDGTVASDVTLKLLTDAILARGGVAYSFAYISPENNADGGQPGGNIRVAFLYNAAKVSLHKTGATPGDADDVNAVVRNSKGFPTLRYNPGLIDPDNSIWDASRKPLVAEWITADGHVFFTVNVHWTSKGGSSSLQGDLRPPVNRPVDKRITQAEVTGAFIAQILKMDRDARIVLAGDLNEYGVVAPVTTLTSVSGMIDLDVAAGVPVNERYTYIFDMNTQEIDHMFVSPAIAMRRPKTQHVHVNTWVSAADQVSDHDPTVAQLNLCGANVGGAKNIASGSPTTVKTTSTAATTATTAPTTAPTTVPTTAPTTAPTTVPTTLTTITTSASTTTGATASATAGALSGKGTFRVVSDGVTPGGNLISGGTWYRGGGTPATYTATADADGQTFTLRTSKGPCALAEADAALSCASTVTTPTSFGFDGTYLTYNSSSTFYAAAVPSGSVQGTVYGSAQAVSLQIGWAASA